MYSNETMTFVYPLCALCATVVSNNMAQSRRIVSTKKMIYTNKIASYITEKRKKYIDQIWDNWDDDGDDNHYYVV